MAGVDSPGLTLQQKLKRYVRTGTEGSFFLPGKNKAFRIHGHSLSLMVETGQGLEAVECIRQVHKDRSYFKREPLLFFLAAATRSQNLEVKKAAYKIVKEVCETPVDLFSYLKHVKVLGQLIKGWGGGLRHTIGDWYNSRDPMELAEFVTRYRQVGRWSHKDVFRMSHIKPANDSVAFLVRYVIKGLKVAKETTPDPSEDVKKVIKYIEAVEKIKHSDDGLTVAMTIEELGLHKEHIPTPLLSSKEVWNTLLTTMSLEQTLHHLTSIARRGFLTIPDATGAAVDPVLEQIQSKVMEKVKDENLVKTEKISPFLIYIIIRTYTNMYGEKKRHDRHGDTVVLMKHKSTSTDPEPHQKKKRKKKKKGQAEGSNHQVKKEAEPSPTDKVIKNNPELYDALHQMFKSAVQMNYPSTGKRTLVCVKAAVSELGKGIRGCPNISALEVMALMSTFIKKKEKDPQLGFFTASFTPMKYPSEIQDLIQEIGNKAAPVPNLPCDPAAPITWALEKKKKFDVFLIIIDGNETEGEVSVACRLDEYRQAMNLPDTKMILCGLTATKLAFAQSSGMLNIGGFDVTVPSIIHEFVMGTLDQ